MRFIKVDEFSRVFVLAALLFLLTLPNGFYLFFPSLAIVVLLLVLQRPYRPSVFSLVALQHFVQIIAGVILCNYLGREIDYNTQSRSYVTIAAAVGLFFLLLPIIYIHSRMPFITLHQFKSYGDNLSVDKAMNLYIIAFFAASVFGASAFLFAGLTQILVSLIKLKWLLFLLFGYLVFIHNKHKNIFFIFVGLEFLSGFFSFFSDFKVVVFYLIILLLNFFEKLEIKKLIIGMLVFFGLVTFGLLWTKIKGEYRSFLNAGSTQQVVGVERNEAIDKLYDLSRNAGNSGDNEALLQMLDRLQYTFHFAKTVDRMPAYLPFENGANWLRSLEFATTPRFLNPNKPNYDATSKTKHYTGLSYLGKESGVSFSLGYFADCYIDFGKYGFYLMLFALGLVYAFFYKYFLTKSSPNLLFNFATVNALFMEFNALELDSTYILGRLFSSLVTFAFLKQFVFPAILKYITIRKGSEKANLSELI
jgi:hypothetical protein